VSHLVSFSKLEKIPPFFLLQSMKHALAKKRESCFSIHLPLQKLELRHLSLNQTVAQFVGLDWWLKLKRMRDPRLSPPFAGFCNTANGFTQLTIL
jgi:hypothetical protein